MPGTAENPIKQANIPNLQRKLQGATAKHEKPTETVTLETGKER